MPNTNGGYRFPMLAHELNFSQKVIALSLLEAIKIGKLSKESAMVVFHKTAGVKMEFIGFIFERLQESYRLLDSEVYYCAGISVWLESGSEKIEVTNAFIQTCSPDKQKLLRLVLQSFGK